MIRNCVVLLLLFCSAATAGDWQPDPTVKYTFTALPESVAPSTPAEDRWVESLTTKLRKGGADPKAVYRFARSSATFDVNGTRENHVYVSRDDPDIYFVVEENYARFIINFRDKSVGANNYGGSIFVPQSKSFCVLVLDKKGWPPGGIPIDSAPGNKATFEARSVSWH
jgi:hypothetical protein